jgi:predicted nucleotidyltransferase
MKTIENVAAEYGQLLRKRLGPHVRRIVLFGSRARGDATDASDYDFLVIVDRRTRDVREAILDVGAEMLNRYDRLFAALTYTDAEWEDGVRFPLGWNIERDGIAV